MDLREERILENERAFEAINRRLKADLKRVDDGDEPVAFVCECGHSECHESVMLSVAEYEAAHDHPARFVIVRGHAMPDVEDVVDGNDRFERVQKHEI